MSFWWCHQRYWHIRLSWGLLPPPFLWWQNHPTLTIPLCTSSLRLAVFELASPQPWATDLITALQIQRAVNQPVELGIFPHHSCFAHPTPVNEFRSVMCSQEEIFSCNPFSPDSTLAFVYLLLSGRKRSQFLWVLVTVPGSVCFSKGGLSASLCQALSEI